MSGISLSFKKVFNLCVANIVLLCTNNNYYLKIRCEFLSGAVLFHSASNLCNSIQLYLQVIKSQLLKPIIKTNFEHRHLGKNNRFHELHPGRP